MSTALAALLGAGVGAGIAPLVFAIFGAGESRSWTPRRVRGREGVRRRLLACGGIGLALGVLTRWTVGALLGMMAAAASIEQAIVATVPLAPEPIRPDLEALALRIRQGQPLAIALRPLADAIDDDTGDLVVGALILAADPTQR